MFNFASMNRARAAGLTLPYLLNVRGGGIDALRSACVGCCRGEAVSRLAWLWTRLCSMRWHGLQVLVAVIVAVLVVVT